MIDPGSVAIGALCMLVIIVALVCVAIWYVASGVRVKLDGLRFVDYQDGLKAELAALRLERQEKPEDFYEMAKERDPE